MNNKLRIAIIIPVFNGEIFLQESIESAINQNYNDKRIILCDDGSYDNSDSIISKYASNKEVSIIKNDTNLGLSKTLEKAFSLAMDSNCSFATIIGQDDLLPNDYISKTIPEFKNSNIQLVYSRLKIIDKFGVATGEQVFPPNLAFYGKFSTKLLLKNNFVTAPGAIFRLNPKNTFFDDVRCDLVQDYSQWLYLSVVGKLKMSIKSYVFYRKHEKNLSNIVNLNRLKREINIIKIDFLEKSRQNSCHKFRLNVK